jgi:putative hydrolase of the HAD superfamily
MLHAALHEGHVGTEPEVWQVYFTDLFRRVGVPEERLPQVGRLVGRAHHEAHLWTWVEGGTAGALDQLREAGYRLAVISNADGRVESLLEEVGLADRFEFVVDSDVVGFEKPDRRIFDHAIEKLDVRAGSCLYVGDLFTVDYVGATGAGMGCLLVDPLGLYASRAPTVSALTQLPELLGSLDTD